MSGRGPRRRSLALRLAVMLLVAAGALTTSFAMAQPRLVPDVSSRRIDIQYSFSGEELLLFGAIVYPGARRPSRPADIVVVLKGPSRPLTVRQKRRVAGIWVNAAAIRLRSAPSYYAIGSSRPVDAILDERTAAIYELGLANLAMSPAGFTDAGELALFENGLVDLYRRLGLYDENGAAVEITDGVLYRARIPIPARVPEGVYVAETFLVSEGRVVAVASRPVTIAKTGFERFVADAAAEHGLLYGLAAILLSLGLGWAAGAMFRRR